MKTTHLLLALCLMLFTFSFVSAQDAKDKTIEFKVTGNCEMCKKTIESSLKGKPGIQAAVWNKNTKVMKVSFDPAKISEDQVHQTIADSGYDTEKKKATDKSYSSLPGCCQYKRTIHAKSK
jgi:periplasmic mercuric ion binding protein